MPQPQKLAFSVYILPFPLTSFENTPFSELTPSPCDPTCMLPVVVSRFHPRSQQACDVTCAALCPGLRSVAVLSRRTNGGSVLDVYTFVAASVNGSFCPGSLFRESSTSSASSGLPLPLPQNTDRAHLSNSASKATFFFPQALMQVAWMGQRTVVMCVEDGAQIVLVYLRDDEECTPSWCDKVKLVAATPTIASRDTSAGGGTVSSQVHVLHPWALDMGTDACRSAA